MNPIGENHRVIRRVLSVLLLAGFLCLSAGQAKAAPSGNYRDYHFIALEEMDLGSNNNLPGNYAVLNDGGDIMIQNGAVQLGNTPNPYVVADTITMAANASIVDAYYGRPLQLAPSSEIRGTRFPNHPFPLTLVDLPPVPLAVFDPCVLSADKIVIPVDGAGTVASGCHGELEAKQGSSVTLSGGIYYFKSWDIKNQVTINVQSASTIYVRQNVRTQEETSVEPDSDDPDDLIFYVGSDSNKRSSIGGFNRFVAVFIDTNNPELNIRKQTEFVGTAVAIKVKLRSVHEDRIPACGDDIVDAGETCDPPGDFFAPNNNVCRADCTFCGDDIQQAGEFCDDGNANNDDGCRNNCTFCGDGETQTQFGEICDDGNAIDDDECDNNCMPPPLCGDNNVDPGEECDDGNDIDDDGCSNDCKRPFCGDGNLNTGEFCDPPGDAFPPTGNICRSDCTFCGDAEPQFGEECDDGNGDDSDDCRNDCTLPFCGDQNLDPGETCDPPGTPSPPTNNACRGNCSYCGDGIVQFGESCDDGNGIDDDACSNACTRCGNGIPEPGEFCDDGNIDDGDSCRNDCTACGDGVLQSGETCDDGNSIDDDACRNSCTYCGDGVQNGSEFCDDGNAEDDDSCRTDCTVCGDGEVQVAFDEVCDDGNSDDTDACNNQCQPGEDEVCGNGIVEPPEFCDDGDLNNFNGCRNDCTACGDGVLQSVESCDDGNDVDDDGCRNDCSFCGDGVRQSGESCDPPGVLTGPNPSECRDSCNFCGDGSVQVEFGENCDDANGVNDDACTNLCLPPLTQRLCGNGVREAGEFCDDGNVSNLDGCRNDCTACGDGVLQAGEQCDDGNGVDDDDCSNSCALPFCGDGNLDPGEECDDGNRDNFDSCRNDCSFEPDEEYCGDGVVSPGESCDDGNDVNTDECRNDCSYCGDGIVQFGEVCDDGNDVQNDACRTDCTYCGDGEVQEQFGELCDDGNTDDTDGCTNICVLPPPPTPPPLTLGLWPKKPWGRKSGLIGNVPSRSGGAPAMRLPLPRLGSR